MLTRILLITSLLAASFTAGARDFEDSYAVYGAGADSCSTYLESMEKGGKEQDYFIDWVVGYFSAFNVIMPNTYDLLGETDFPTAQRWLERDCQRYPKQLFISAVIKLSEVLYPMRYQSGLKQGSVESAPADEKAAKAAEKAPVTRQ
jgi:hypothetical protein